MRTIFWDAVDGWEPTPSPTTASAVSSKFSANVMSPFVKVCANGQSQLQPGVVLVDPGRRGFCSTTVTCSALEPTRAWQFHPPAHGSSRFPAETLPERFSQDEPRHPNNQLGTQEQGIVCRSWTQYRRCTKSDRFGNLCRCLADANRESRTVAASLLNVVEETRKPLRTLGTFSQLDHQIRKRSQDDGASITSLLLVDNLPKPNLPLLLSSVHNLSAAQQGQHPLQILVTFGARAVRMKLSFTRLAIHGHPNPNVVHTLVGRTANTQSHVGAQQFSRPSEPRR